MNSDDWDRCPELLIEALDDSPAKVRPIAYWGRSTNPPGRDRPIDGDPGGFRGWLRQWLRKLLS